MISVIVPIYNAEKYLHRCIDSILAQSYTDFELLLIDDGSPDNSGAICDNYAAKDGRIRVFHKENGGVSSARNIGIKYAIGDWISFIDSDDYVNCDYLYELYKYHISADLIIGSFQMVGTNIEDFYGIIPVNSFTRTQFKDMLVLYGGGENLGCACFKLYKRDIIRRYNILYNDNISASEDWLFTLDYLRYIHTICTSDKPNYYYERSNSESLSQHNRDFDSYFYAMEQFYNKVAEVEQDLGVDGLDSIYIDVIRNFIRKQVKYLYFNKQIAYNEKISKIKKLLNNPYVQLVLRDKTRCKSRKKFRIFDFIALKKLYRLLLLFIYVCKGSAY